VSWALIRKELRDQRAFAFFGVALLIYDLVDMVLGQFDLFRLGKEVRQLSVFAVFQLLLSFAMGTGLVIREIDDGTLSFLEGLPVTRSRLFFTKLATAVLVLLIYPCSSFILMAAQHLASRQSLDHALHSSLLLIGFGLLAMLTLVGLSCGLLLGFLRNLSWLALAVSAIAVNLLARAWPRLTALNPVELATMRFVGDHWLVPTEYLLVQGAIVVATTLLALWAFTAAGAGRMRSLDLSQRRPLVSALVAVATMVACLSATALYSRSKPESKRDAVSQTVADFTPAPPGHAQTQHYTFSYPAHNAEQLRPLLEEADATFAAVAAALGVDGGAVIDVDLSGSMTNTEGTAFFDRIKMIPNGRAALNALAHETTHVFALRLAGGKYERELSKMPVFNEGLAQWMERNQSPHQGATRLDRLQAGIVSERHLVNAAALTDLETLGRDVDENLKYPLGAALVEVFVQRYGVAAPKTLLQTLGRPDFPRALQGLPLWQAAFQMSGFDLALVFDDYARRLQACAEEFAPTIAELPRPRASLVRGSDAKWVGVELRVDKPLPEGWISAVRFRPKVDSPLREYVTRWTSADTVWRSTSTLTNREVCFQPGVGSRGVVIFEAWTCLPLDSAAVAAPGARGPLGKI
jgi:hypothetical protein